MTVVDAATSTLPTFVTSSFVSNGYSTVVSFVFAPTTATPVSVTTLNVTLLDGALSSQIYSFKIGVIVTANMPPFFSSSILAYQSVTVGQVSTYSLPSINDPENQKVTVTLGASTFANLTS